MEIVAAQISSTGFIPTFPIACLFRLPPVFRAISDRPSQKKERIVPRVWYFQFARYRPLLFLSLSLSLWLSGSLSLTIGIAGRYGRVESPAVSSCLTQIGKLLDRGAQSWPTKCQAIRIIVISICSSLSLSLSLSLRFATPP